MQVDCSRWLAGFVELRNTEQRKEELVGEIDSILTAGKMSKQQALKLRGRMQFAKSQIWSRSAKLCLSAITDHAYSGSGDVITSPCELCLVALRESLISSQPRIVSAVWASPLFVFTGGM